MVINKQNRQKMKSEGKGQKARRRKDSCCQKHTEGLQAQRQANRETGSECLSSPCSGGTQHQEGIQFRPAQDSSHTWFGFRLEATPDGKRPVCVCVCVCVCERERESERERV